MKKVNANLKRGSEGKQRTEVGQVQLNQFDPLHT